MIAGRLLTGLSLLVLVSQAFAGQPRFGRTTRTATTARTEPSDRDAIRLRLPMLQPAPKATERPQLLAGFRPAAGNVPSRRARGNDFVVGPAGQDKPVLVTTRLQIQTASRPPQQPAGQWGNSIAINTPGHASLRWTTGEASAAAGRWVLYNTRTPGNRTAPIASGVLSPVPAEGEWAHFEVDLSDSLPAAPFRHTSYWMHVLPLGEGNQAVAPASPWVQIRHVHPPTDLAATLCKLVHGKVDWGEHTVTCRAQNVGPYRYEGSRTYTIIRYVHNAPQVVKTGVIPAGLDPGQTFTTYYNGYGGNPVGTFFAFRIAPGDGNASNDRCVSQ